MRNKFCFQVDNEEVVKIYENNANCRIEYSDKNSDICVIYFSSHGIYYPNDEKTFISKIVNKDYYEWYKTRLRNAKKHIFIRDVKKQWYISGINKNIDDQWKLADFLKKETSGYKVITLGASAGGYASILFGNLIEAEYIIAFNPRIELETELNNTKEEENALLHRNKETKTRCFFDVNKFISGNIPVYYILSNKSGWDLQQCKCLVPKNNLNIVEVDSDVHGVPVPKDILPLFIEKLIGNRHLYLNKVNTYLSLYTSVSYSAAARYIIRQLKRKIRSCFS